MMHSLRNMGCTFPRSPVYLPYPAAHIPAPSPFSLLPPPFSLLPSPFSLSLLFQLLFNRFALVQSTLVLFHFHCRVTLRSFARRQLICQLIGLDGVAAIDLSANNTEQHHSVSLLHFIHSLCPVEPKEYPLTKSLLPSLAGGDLHRHHVHQSLLARCIRSRPCCFGDRYAHHLCRWSQILLLQWNTVLHQR